MSDLIYSAIHGFTNKWLETKISRFCTLFRFPLKVNIRIELLIILLSMISSQAFTFQSSTDCRLLAESPACVGQAYLVPAIIQIAEWFNLWFLDAFCPQASR